MKQFVRFLWIYWILALAMGCSHDLVEYDRELESASVILSLDVAVSGRDVTRAMSGEQESVINSLTALVFHTQTDDFCYTAKTQYKSSGEYRIILNRPAGNTTEDLYLVLLANLDEDTQSLLPSYQDRGAIKDELLRKLVYRASEAWPTDGAAVKALPLWAETKSFSITRNTKEEDIQLGTVSLLRALAALDVKVDVSALENTETNIVPMHFYIYNSRTSGWVVPLESSFDTTGQVTTPSVPGDAGIQDKPLDYAFETNEFNLMRKIYLPETPKDAPIYGILEGKSITANNDIQPCYYYVEFKNEAGDVAYPLLRNWRYELTIPIKGVGATSIDAAIKGTPAENVVVKKVEWETDQTDDNTSLDLEGEPVHVKLTLIAEDPVIVQLTRASADADMSSMDLTLLQYLDNVLWNRVDMVVNPQESSLEKNTYVYDAELKRPNNTKKQRIVVLASKHNGTKKEETNGPLQIGSSLSELYQAYSVGGATDSPYAASGISEIIPNLTEGAEISVRLIRAMARIDFGIGLTEASGWTVATNSVTTGSFALKGVSLYSSTVRSALVPELAGDPQIQEFCKGVMSQAAEADWRTKYLNTSPTNLVIHDGASIANYVGESPLRKIESSEQDKFGGVAGIHAESVCESYLIVRGQYTKDENMQYPESYYRIDFVQNGKPLALLRNHRYIVNITDVSGAGAATPDAATSENITVDITVDTGDMSEEVVTDGHYYMGVSLSNLFFNGLGEPTLGDSRSLLSTDYPKWTAKVVDGSEGWINWNTKGGAGKNQNFVWAPNETLEHNATDDIRHVRFKATAGNLSREVLVMQSPLMAADFRFEAEQIGECNCYETEAPVRVSIDSKFGGMQWKGWTSFLPGTTNSGWGYYLRKEGGLFSKGPQSGKMYEDVAAYFTKLNTSNEDRIVNANFQLDYNSDRVQTTAVVRQKAPKATPLRIKFFVREQNVYSGNYGLGLGWGTENTISAEESGITEEYTYEFTPDPELVLGSGPYYAGMYGQNRSVYDVTIRLASDNKMPRATVEIENVGSNVGIGRIPVLKGREGGSRDWQSDVIYATSGGAPWDWKEHVNGYNGEFKFLWPSAFSDHKSKITLDNNNPNAYFNVLGSGLFYLKKDASASVLISTECGQKVRINFKRKAATSGLRLSSEALTVDYSAGSSTIVVQALPIHCEWTAKSDADWLTLSSTESPDYPSDASQVTISYKANTAGQRTGTITFTHRQDPSITKKLTVTQKQLKGTLTVSPNFVQIPTRGGSFNITVNSTGGGWRLTSKPSWCSANVSSGNNGAATIAFTAGMIDAGATSARQGTLVFQHATDSNVKAYVTLMQNPAALWLSATSLAFPVKGGTKTFIVYSRGLPWKLTERVGVSPLSGGDYSDNVVATTVTISASPNASGDGYYANSLGSVLFVTQTNGKTVSIALSQAGGPTGKDPGIKFIGPAYASSVLSACGTGYRPIANRDYNYNSSNGYSMREDLALALDYSGLKDAPKTSDGSVFGKGGWFPSHISNYQNGQPFWVYMEQYNRYAVMCSMLVTTTPTPMCWRGGGLILNPYSYPYNYGMTAYIVCLKTSVWGQ